MADLLITSAANPRLKGVIALRRRRLRDELGLTVVEGTEELSLAVSAGVTPATVYWCPELFTDPGPPRLLLNAARAEHVETVQLSRAVFERVAYREGPDGILAVVPTPGRALPTAWPPTARTAWPPTATGPAAGTTGPAYPLVLLAQGVEKPGNLGAMLRTADAAGVDLVVAADPVTDWGNPNVVRASKGTVFSVPCAAASTTEALAWLAAQGVALVATTPDTELDYADVDYHGPVAIAVGAEKHGLTSEVLDAATYLVRIPMAGRADSLNVSVSAAVVLYEAVRQRRGGGQKHP
jgi:TrmH family RNA methyltransferase